MQAGTNLRGALRELAVFIRVIREIRGSVISEISG
jgi:hypothetical protein